VNASLEAIYGRIESKKQDYLRYDFAPVEDDAFKTFFDLAQELDRPEDFYSLCVAIPKSFFGMEARLYTIRPEVNKFVLAAATEPDKTPGVAPDQPEAALAYTETGSVVLCIRGKELLVGQLPFETRDEVIALLEIYPVAQLSEHEALVYVKYANRIGYNLHNRFLVERNVEHLRFIRSLVADIEHNIIAPNIVYKLYLKTLGGAVNKSTEVAQALDEYRAAGKVDPERLEAIITDMAGVNRKLVSELAEIEKHHRNMSLFLETLLRRSHFDQGRLTLRTKRCNVHRDVLVPQLERYMDRFRSLGIEVDEQASGIPEEKLISVVDVGLMSQVYANLFSNALKYATEVQTFYGPKKYMAYGHEVIRDFFGSGRSGLKYNVFSTGPHIPPEERTHIFEDKFRGSNSEGRPGTGHGLAFIKNVVEIHGGVVGYEPTQFGNNFYFILPE
jgi:signal transduction histidine kinase